MKHPIKNIVVLKPSQMQKSNFVSKGIPIHVEMAEKKVKGQADKQTNKQTNTFVFI